MAELFSYKLTPEEYQRLADFIYRDTGLRYPEEKRYFLDRRVEKRMKDLGMLSFNQYLNYLKGSPAGGELQALINAITVNETYFFRDYGQLKCFAEEVLPLILKELSPAAVKVWSAGCSTGEEPYTLAIILREMLGGTGTGFEVHATDIDTGALAAAQAGVYGERSVKDVPHAYLNRYFDRTAGGYAVRPEIKKHVKFYRLNLSSPGEMAAMSGFHAIFCRNVLIYFDDRSRRVAAESFYRALVPGGYIFLGHSEFMGRISSLFAVRRFKWGIVYQKEK